MHFTAKGSSLLHQDGGLYNLGHLSALGAGDTLSDFVSWHWESPYVLHFVPRSAAYPLDSVAAAQFRGLCDAIVANFPGILRRPDPYHELRGYGDDDDGDRLWTLDGTTLSLREQGLITSSREVVSQHGLQHGSTTIRGERRVRQLFACIPQFTKLVQIDMLDSPWCPKRRFLKRALKASVAKRGRFELDVRTAAWGHDDDEIASALAKITWTELLTATGFSSYDSQLWHRLKLHQLTLWPTGEVQDECRRHDCHLPYDASTGHIMWRCTAAQRLWTHIVQLGESDTDAVDWRSHIFGWEAPPTNRDWIGKLAPELGEHAEVHERLDHWLRVLWQLLVTCGAQRLWAGQVRLLFPNENRWVEDSHAVEVNWRAKCQHVLEGLVFSTTPTASLDKEIVRRVLRHTSTESEGVPHFELQQDHFLLFFDGGSRKNPGAGGSGSVIVRMASPPTLLWAASFSYANKATTNNYAEFQGLCHGLYALHKYKWHPATVVGDSLMIISLLRRRTPPKSKRLQPLYTHANALAHKTHITGWNHHYRDRNKMADKAANTAMDTCTSFEALASSGRIEFGQLTPWLDNDVQPWLDATLTHSRRHNPV